VVSRRRPLGARLIETLGAQVIIMDDGFQNPTLRKDISIIAVDGGAGLGNGQVFPAGPLRAPYGFQLARTSAVVVSGGPADQREVFAGFSGPVLSCTVRPAQETGWLTGQKAVAFCGIGRPEKFFDTLRQAGATLAAAVPFPDHHVFTEAEAAGLLDKAKSAGAALVTTEKDWVRLPAEGLPALAALRRETRALPVEAVFSSSDESALKALVLNAIKAHQPVE
jgi:tetraacyldisaccharide 4'-kinase